MSPASTARADRESIGSVSNTDETPETLIGQDRPEFGDGSVPPESPSGFETLAGERGTSALHRTRSLQSRASQVRRTAPRRAPRALKRRGMRRFPVWVPLRLRRYRSRRS
jgi:hypothetical protein